MSHCYSLSFQGEKIVVAVLMDCSASVFSCSFHLT